MKKIFILLTLFPGLVLANNFSKKENLSYSKFSLEKILKADLPDYEERPDHPMPPGPYPVPEPARPRILCLTVGSQGYGGNILFYGFGPNGQLAARRSQMKCLDFGLYNCRIWWCNEVY